MEQVAKIAGKLVEVHARIAQVSLCVTSALIVNKGPYLLLPVHSARPALQTASSVPTTEQEGVMITHVILATQMTLHTRAVHACLAVKNVL